MIHATADELTTLCVCALAFAGTRYLSRYGLRYLDVRHEHAEDRHGNNEAPAWVWFHP